MQIKYLSKDLYNSTLNKATEKKYFWDRVAEIEREYSNLSRESLLNSLAYKICRIKELEEWRENDEKFFESMKIANKTIIGSLENEISRLEKDIGKKAEFYSRNKEPAIVVQMSK